MLLVLAFELRSMLKKKSFIISTLIVMISAFVLLSIPRFLSDDDTEEVTTKDKTMMIYDEHKLVNEEMLQVNFPEYTITYTDSLEELKTAVKEQKTDAGFEVKSDVEFMYYVNNSSLNDANADRFETYMKQQYQTKELSALHYDMNKIQQIYNAPVTSDTLVLGTDGQNNYYYTYILILVLYMMILIYGNQIGVGVASEKSNRAIEILTTSCSPNALIFGKVFAGAIAGVIQTSIMIGSFLLAYQINAAQWNHMLDRFLQIPTLVLITFALFGVLGYLLFSFLFGAIGAMCSKVEEVNGATMPIQLLIIAVFFISYMTLYMPDSVLAKVACYIPFTSWMCMFVNVAVGSVSMIEIMISLIILLITVILMGLAGAKLYRRGTLTYGNGVKLRNLFSILKKKNI